VTFSVLIIIAAILAFGAVVLLIAGLVASRRVDPVATRLESIATVGEGESSAWWAQRRRTRSSIFERVLARLAGFLPNSEGDASIRDGLIEAGYRRPTAIPVFIGAKLALAAILPVVFLIVMVGLGNSLSQQLLPALAIAVFGFYLPTLWLWSKANKRRMEITHALPDALDLTVVCVESGLALDAALVKVAQEIELSSPELSQELDLVNREVRAGSPRVDALRNLARRTGVQDVQSLVAVLVQTDRLGTSVATALRAQSDSLRIRRRQRAEELAHKTGVKLVFPLVMCIFPGLLVILLAPAMLRVLKALGGITD
jgi:tight adherence protein C